MLQWLRSPTVSLSCSLRRSNCSQKCEWLWTVWGQLGKYFKILSTIKRVNNFLWFSSIILLLHLLYCLSLALSVFTFCFAKHFLVIWSSVSVCIDNIVVTVVADDVVVVAVVAAFITTSTALRHALHVMLESLHLQLCESALISLRVCICLCMCVCVCLRFTFMRSALWRQCCPVNSLINDLVISSKWN